MAIMLLPAGVRAADARPHGNAPWERIDAVREVLGDAAVLREGIEMDLPLVTQEGGSVPITVGADPPNGTEDPIVALYLFAAGNPSPEVAEFRFGPRAGAARVSTRIRLDRTQFVIALARTKTGIWLAEARKVRVTVSGCLSRAAAGPADEPMQTRVRAPDRLAAGEAGEVRTLIVHPMETGLRDDDKGQRIPQRIIRGFRAEFDQELVLEARLHRAIAANPFLHFSVAPQATGSLKMSWEEDTGARATASAEIPVR